MLPIWTNMQAGELLDVDALNDVDLASYVQKQRDLADQV